MKFYFLIKYLKDEKWLVTLKRNELKTWINNFDFIRLYLPEA